MAFAFADAGCAGASDYEQPLLAAGVLVARLVVARAARLEGHHGGLQVAGGGEDVEVATLLAGFDVFHGCSLIKNPRRSRGLNCFSKCMRRRSLAVLFSEAVGSFDF